LLKHLDPGERDAILLAESLNADLILLDESRGRQAARQRNLKMTGTLGLLDRAASQGLIDLSAALDLLSQTNFRISPRLLQQFKS
jgi:predicted nucleic acid-binding protein